MKALQIHAGATALKHLRERGLSPADVRIIPAAAGGPKGLILNGLDRFIFGDWLRDGAQAVHLLGASIGAWRMATACLPDPSAQLAQMAVDYIHQDYEHAPGKPPTPSHVSEVFGNQLKQRFERRDGEVLGHARYHLHVFTSRGRHVLRRQGRLRTPLGYAGAFLANTVSRRAMGGWLERVVFSDTREPLPLRLHDYRTQQVALSALNLQPTTARRRSRSAPTTSPPACSRAARFPSGSTRCTTSPARRAAPTGTAASPTTTCTWTTARCPTAWCCTRTSRRPSSRAGSTRR
jgi:hypothetical protein